MNAVPWILASLLAISVPSSAIAGDFDLNRAGSASRALQASGTDVPWSEVSPESVAAPLPDRLPPNSLPWNAHRIFITSQVFDGRMIGQWGADRKCQASARAAGLGGTWRALLTSTDYETARQRLSIRGPVFDTAGWLIALDRDDLWKGTIRRPVWADEFGQNIGLRPGEGEILMWTGSNVVGERLGEYSSYTCGDWRLNIAGNRFSNGVVGQVSDSGLWLQYKTVSCSEAHHLYCIDGQSGEKPDLVPTDIRFDGNYQNSGIQFLVITYKNVGGGLGSGPVDFHYESKRGEAFNQDFAGEVPSPGRTAEALVSPEALCLADDQLQSVTVTLNYDRRLEETDYGNDALTRFVFIPKLPNPPYNCK